MKQGNGMHPTKTQQLLLHFFLLAICPGPAWAAEPDEPQKYDHAQVTGILRLDPIQVDEALAAQHATPLLQEQFLKSAQGVKAVSDLKKRKAALLRKRFYIDFYGLAGGAIEPYDMASGTFKVMVGYYRPDEARWKSRAKIIGDCAFPTLNITELCRAPKWLQALAERIQYLKVPVPKKAAVEIDRRNSDVTAGHGVFLRLIFRVEGSVFLSGHRDQETMTGNKKIPVYFPKAKDVEIQFVDTEKHDVLYCTPKRTKCTQITPPPAQEETDSAEPREESPETPAEQPEEEGDAQE